MEGTELGGERMEGADMEVKILFKKEDGSEILPEVMSKEEKKQQARLLMRRFMESMGYTEKAARD